MSMKVSRFMVILFALVLTCAACSSRGDGNISNSSDTSVNDSRVESNTIRDTEDNNGSNSSNQNTDSSTLLDDIESGADELFNGNSQDETSGNNENYSDSSNSDSSNTDSQMDGNNGNTSKTQ